MTDGLATDRLVVVGVSPSEIWAPAVHVFHRAQADPSTESAGRNHHAASGIHGDVASGIAAPPEHLGADWGRSITGVRNPDPLGSVPLLDRCR